MADKEFSEAEVNQMLENQAIKLRITGVEDAVKEMSKEITEHMAAEEHNQDKLMTAISDSTTERRRVEQEIHVRISQLDEKTVKKADLKLYALLIIGAISLTTGLITFIGNESAKAAQMNSMTQMFDKFEQLIDKKGKK